MSAPVSQPVSGRATGGSDMPRHRETQKPAQAQRALGQNASDLAEMLG
ncbi:hypothetical protein [Glutamicibacter sp. NPDC087344]